MFSLAVRKSLLLLPVLALAACGGTEPPASPEATAAPAAAETVAAAAATPQVDPANWPQQPRALHRRRFRPDEDEDAAYYDEGEVAAG